LDYFVLFLGYTFNKLAVHHKEKQEKEKHEVENKNKHDPAEIAS